MDLFKKSIIVGVSVTPEVGLEVALVDFSTRTVLKYGSKPLDYNNNLREIADLDLFKGTLSDLFSELDIPGNARIVLNIPPATFKVNDYPAALDEIQISNAVEEELLQNPIFKNDNEPCTSLVKLPNSTIQFSKIAYTSASRNMILEIALAIKDLGYKLHAINTSVSSTLNALMYLERINTDVDTNWVLLLVENNCCRIISMMGRNFIDEFEEKISIGEVLGETENYSTVIDAVEPILKNLPSKYLCVVSKTNVISAKALSNKLNYSAPITYQEANIYSKEAFLSAVPEINSESIKNMSLDVIGAAIYREFEPYSPASFNLYNKSLGDIYLLEQPPEISIGKRTVVLSNELLVRLFISICAIAIPLAIISFVLLFGVIRSQNSQLEEINDKIQTINKFLEENKKISSEIFDEGTSIATGLTHNKAIYSYYTIVGTEIPKKLWLTHLKLGDKTTIEGQADNLESVYAFFRSIKDYNTDSGIKLQKLGLATGSNKINGSDFDTESILTSLNADFYEFRISNEPEIKKEDVKDAGNKTPGLPEGLEPISE